MNDINSAQKELSKRVTFFLLSNVLPVFFIIFGEIFYLIISLLIGVSTFDIVFLICYPIVSLSIIFLIPKLFSRLIKQQEKIISDSISRNPAVKIRISSEGIQTDSTIISYNLKWGYFTKIVELKQFFYFHFSDYEQLVIPKRAFSEEQTEKLYNMLADYINPKLTKIKLMKNRKGEK
jgi:hypothetical protein